MKPTIKLIALIVVLFVIVFFVAFLFLFSFLNLFYTFNIISAKILFIISLGVSSLIALAAILYVLYGRKFKISKFRIFLSENFPGIMLFFFVLMFISISVRPEIIWDRQGLKDFISLQWTIFGLSVTIFLVWEVVLSRMIKDQKPKKIGEPNLLSEIQFINEKREYRENISQKYFLVFYLILNLFILLPATSYAYMPTIEISLFSQSLIITSFYICTNTLLQLLLDIIMLIFRAKKEAFSDNRITNQDIDKFNKTTDLLYKYADAIAKIDELPDLDNKKRQELKDNLASELVKIVNCESKNQNALTINKNGNGENK